MGAEYENKGDFKEEEYLPEEKTSELKSPDEEAEKAVEEATRWPQKEEKEGIESEEVEDKTSNICDKGCCPGGAIPPAAIMPEEETSLTPEEYLGQKTPSDLTIKTGTGQLYDEGPFGEKMDIDNEIVGLLTAISGFTIKMQDRFIDKVAEGKKDWDKTHFHGEMEMKLRRRLNKHPFEEMDLIDIANYAMLIWNLRYNQQSEKAEVECTESAPEVNLDGHREFAAPNDEDMVQGDPFMPQPDGDTEKSE